MSLRLSVVVLGIALGSAHAADWKPLPKAAQHAVPNGRTAPEVRAVPRIINGDFTNAFPAVAGVVIWNPTDTVLCTGTLVGPSVVLTAAHCVSDEPVAIRVTFFHEDGTGEQYMADAYAIHPQYSFPRADLAMLLLEAPVAGIAPVPLAPRKPRSGKAGTIVGYGQDEGGNVGVKEVGMVRLMRCPRRVPALGLSSGSLARALCWQAQSWEQTTCHGDSGGPLLIGDSLAGVTSGGEANCSGLLSWDTSVVPFRRWIRGLMR